MTTEHLIEQWGYWAVMLGTFLEGETIPMLAGFAAHQGFLRLDLVIICSFLGSFAGDQMWFWVGRRFGKGWLLRHPGKAANIDRVSKMLDRWGDWYVLSFRFLYGLRTISPIALGLSSISAVRYTILNMLSGMVWAVIVGGAGYVFGNALEAVLGKFSRWEHRLIAGAAMALVLFVFHQWVKHRLLRKADASHPLPSGEIRS